MKKRVISVATMCVMLLACKTKDHEVSPESKAIYFPITVGSQWIYDTYQLIDGKDEVKPEYRDTVTITGDTIIDQKKYVVVEHSLDNHPWFPVVHKSMYRDSAGYLLNPMGKEPYFSPIFDPKDTIYTYNNMVIIGKFVMKKLDQKITVPAGTFNVVDSEGNWFFEGKPSMPQTHHYYAQNVGLIYEDARYLSSQDINFKRLLVSYHIK